MSKARPKSHVKSRRWLQFSLRTLLLLMAVVAIIAAWFGNRLIQARKQPKAVSQLTTASQPRYTPPPRFPDE
jgi:type II secretory pathway component PulL